MVIQSPWLLTNEKGFVKPYMFTPHTCEAEWVSALHKASQNAALSPLVAGSIPAPPTKTFNVLPRGRPLALHVDGVLWHHRATPFFVQAHELCLKVVDEVK
jgi:hypothetical protein